MKKLAIVATHPIQYQTPIWRDLAERSDLDVHVYYGSDFSVRGYRDSQFGVTFKWDVPLTEGYAHTFLSTGPSTEGLGGFFHLRAHNLMAHLRRFRPDCALISAYTPFFWWEAVKTLRVCGIPIMIRSEATDIALPRSASKAWVRKIFLRAFYSQCTAFLAIGKVARQHFLAHGVRPEQMFFSPYSVDTRFFSAQAQEHLPQRGALRRALGFTDTDILYLYSAKLIPKKDPLTLARALQAIPEPQRQTLGLIVVGDGELRSEVEAMCKEALGARAVFAGFVNQSQIGRFYALADCLVLPSAWGETWGLVVNEAMQFGLPAILSDRVGCHPDLLIEGETGYVFPAGDVEALRGRLLDAAHWLSQGRSLIAERCQRQVAGYTAAHAADGICAGVQSIGTRRAAS